MSATKDKNYRGILFLVFENFILKFYVLKCSNTSILHIFVSLTISVRIKHQNKERNETESLTHFPLNVEMGNS